MTRSAFPLPKPFAARNRHELPCHNPCHLTGFVSSSRERLKLPENTRAILYRRVSTADQSLGLAAQLEAFEAMADQRGWTPERVTDEAVSGSVPAENRPALGPALDAMGPGDVLAVSKLDKFSSPVFLICPRA